MSARVMRPRVGSTCPPGSVTRGRSPAGVPLNGAAQVIGGQPGTLAQVGDRQVAGHWSGAGSTELSEPQLFGDPVAAGLVDQQLQTLDPTAHPSSSRRRDRFVPPASGETPDRHGFQLSSRPP